MQSQNNLILLWENITKTIYLQVRSDTVVCMQSYYVALRRGSTNCCTSSVRLSARPSSLEIKSHRNL